MSLVYRHKYRLELHWSNIEYLNDKVANLTGVYFAGPVLKDAAKLEAPDFIDLDLTPQLLTLLDSYYIVRLDWEQVEYVGDRVYLKGARFTNNVLKEFHKLMSDDYILINTEKHEEEVHAYNLVYESQVLRSDNKPYSYKDK